MVHYETKINFNDEEFLNRIINEGYLIINNDGINISSDKIFELNNNHEEYSLFDELNSIVVKIKNTNIIDGFFRVYLKNTENGVSFSPVDMYVYIDNDKYTFY